MITLEQIQKLDQKVQAAVGRISALSRENTELKGKLDEYQKRIGELEVLISTFKQDQTEIEKGILRALEQLDHLEDSVDESASNGDQEAVVEQAPVVESADEPEKAAVAEEAAEPTPEPAEAAPDQDDSELDIF